MKPAPYAVDWAAIIRDPAAFDDLPPDVQAAVYAEVASVEARLRAKMLQRARPAVDPSADPERALRIEEAAARLAMSKDYVYRHWKRLGGFRDVDGHLKFSVRTLQAHMRRIARR